MTAKEFLLKKIESEWKQDLRDVSYDNLEKLSKALDEYAEIKNHGVSHHVSDDSERQFFDGDSSFRQERCRRSGKSCECESKKQCLYRDIKGIFM